MTRLGKVCIFLRSQVSQLENNNIKLQRSLNKFEYVGLFYLCTYRRMGNQTLTNFYTLAGIQQLQYTVINRKIMTLDTCMYVHAYLRT
jgi:hypothetical protein